MILTRYFLYPFAAIYSAIMRFRNWLFDKEVFKHEEFELPIIGIGNLSAGGTGKTPMAEYLLKLLKENSKTPAFLSRGYGRKSKGYFLATRDSAANQIGDEAYQVKRKFPDVAVTVCEDRVEGVKMLKKDHPEIDVVVLDDSYQHRKIKPGFSILLTDFARPYYKDAVLPAGLLRESTEQRARADVIIMTKCPSFPEKEQKAELVAKLQPFPGQEVYFTCVGYKNIMQADGRVDSQSFSLDHLKGYQVILFAGIADPNSLIAEIKSLGVSLSILRFSDHHFYNESDIRKILKRWKEMEGRNKLILTTEKDWRRLEHSEQAKKFADLPVYYIPIEVRWEEAEKRSFDQKILKYVGANQGGS